MQLRPSKARRHRRRRNERFTGHDAASDDSADAGDPGLLPQTNDKPDASAPEFSARMQLLWSAILHDNAELAIPAFFPAHRVRADERRSRSGARLAASLVQEFQRDIHALHVEVASTGVGMSARLVRVDLNDKQCALDRAGRRRK